MYIRKTTATIRGKTYTNYVLVESVNTPRGPRQKTICSLGSLSPRPAEQWLALARKIEQSLCGQQSFLPDDDRELVEATVEKIRSKPVATQSSAPAAMTDGCLRVDVDNVHVEDAREAGPVYVGCAMYERLDIDGILRQCGLGPRTRLLTKIMTIKRLVCPMAEHAMPDWVGRTALADIIGAELKGLSDAALYRTMGKLHRHRGAIERQLRHAERSLFGLDDTIMLYDLTSHYFEGQCPFNPQAKRGYSRDSRPDCKQVVVGVVFDGQGFPYCHQVFDGNARDCATLGQMLERLRQECGAPPQCQPTVVVDRGMAFDDNIRQIKDAGFHYIVAARQPERMAWLEEFAESEGFHELIRIPSPLNPGQKKSRVQVKKIRAGDELVVLCISEGRREKDRAIRLRFEEAMKKEVARLEAQIRGGRLTAAEHIYERIGRIKERYPRVARYYSLDYDAASASLRFHCREEKRAIAQQLDGGYILKTDRMDMDDEQIWRTYMLLTRAENAFRNMKSPLSERPIFHHLQDRVHVHIFLCVLAYHLLVAIEKPFLDRGIHTSWHTIRNTLATHQIVTVALPTDGALTVRIRKPTKAEKCHEEIYDALGIPSEIIKPRKWRKAKD